MTTAVFGQRMDVRQCRTPTVDTEAVAAAGRRIGKAIDHDMVSVKKKQAAPSHDDMSATEAVSGIAGFVYGFFLRPFVFMAMLYAGMWLLTG